MEELDKCCIHFVIAEGSLPWRPMLEAKLANLFSFVVLAFWLQYRSSNFRRLNRNNLSALYRNLVGFGLVTMEITILEIVTLL